MNGQTAGLVKVSVRKGLLLPDRIDVALAAMSRFAAIMQVWVSTVHAVATAAVRRAANGDDFTAPAEAIIGHPINVLSQDEEAHFVARGLTLNMPNATGLVADLGGGSLEVVALVKGQVRHATSFNFGHLSEVLEQDIDLAMADKPWISKYGSSASLVLAALFVRWVLPISTGLGTRFPCFTGFAFPDVMQTLC